MKYTLLELVQEVLSSMDSDEVNSISDTVESEQVVTVIKTVYNDIVSRSGSLIFKSPFTLEASGDATKPTLMTKPSNIVTIDWIRYNGIRLGETDPNWQDVSFLPIEDFVLRSSQLNPSEAEVESSLLLINGFPVTINYENNGAPTYYTALGDNELVFNSYDSAIDSTLQTSKTLCYGTRDSTFLEDDTWVPELQPDQFSLLLNEAKSLAWAELKQVPHAKAESTARKNWTHLARNQRDNNTDTFFNRTSGPNFGRK